MMVSTDITVRLVDWSNGDEDALNELLPFVNSELKRLAKYYIRRIRPGNTLQPTALINEAYLRLVDQNKVHWQNRAHFFAIAASMMLPHFAQLYSRPESPKTGRRGGSHIAVGGCNSFKREVERNPCVEEALERFAALDPRRARVVELRHYGGLSVEETAEVLKISKVTVMRDWNFARGGSRGEIRNNE